LSQRRLVPEFREDVRGQQIILVGLDVIIQPAIDIPKIRTDSGEAALVAVFLKPPLGENSRFDRFLIASRMC